MSANNLLYEVKETYRWKLDRELVPSKQSHLGTRLIRGFDIRNFFSRKNKDLYDHYESQLPWQLAVSNKERTLVAILQDTCLEIRHVKDDYKKLIGISTITEDVHQQFRKLTWSADGTSVAFASSHGELRCYNTLATLICCIPRIENTLDTCLISPNVAVSALFLLEVRTKSPEWPFELIAIDYFGNLRSYFVSSTQGYKPYYTFSFGESLVTSATYIPLWNILLIAQPTSKLSQDGPDDTLGLSSWRLLADYPYYRLVKPDIDTVRFGGKEKSWLSLFKSRNRTIVLKMVPSIDYKYLACMHLCGTVTVWTLPQLRLYKIWSQQDLSIVKSSMPLSLSKNVLNDINWCLDTSLVLIENDGSLSVSNLDCLENLLTRINPNCQVIECQPESFSPSVRLANVCDMNIGFLILDYESKNVSSWRRESDSSGNQLNTSQTESGTVDIYHESLLRQVLRFFIDFEVFQKHKKLLYVQKTYKLILMKKVTPTEYYEQKINIEKYAEALRFAKLFNLDETRVFKKQWTNNPVTVESIDNYLMQVGDKLWILRECCDRVPETFEAAEMLLRKGLEYTDFAEFILDDELSCNKLDEFLVNMQESYNSASTDETEIEKLDFVERFEINADGTTTNFSKNQLNILIFRKCFLLYLDALFVYQKILELNGHKYDENSYRKFRHETPLHLVISFAQEGNVNGIYVMFLYYSQNLKPHWLQVLDNIPECLRPASYKQLLPAFSDDGKFKSLPTKSIRSAEWSESGDFKDLIALKNFIKQYEIDQEHSLSIEEVSDWYAKKIRSIVNQSSLVDYALELLDLAVKNGISKLEELRHNLLVLEKLIYDIGFDEEKTLEDVENYSDFEKLNLLMSKVDSREMFSIAIHETLFPFLDRCDNLRTNSKDLILDSYVKQISEYDLSLCASFFDYLNERDVEHVMFSARKKFELRLLSVYSCTRIDQANIALQIIDVDSEFSDNNNSGLEEIINLRSRLNEAHLELLTLHVLIKYGAEKSVAYLHENKRNETFQNETFSRMVNKIIECKTTDLEEVTILLDDMVYLQQNYFTSLRNNVHLRIFAYLFLTSGEIYYVERCAPFVLSYSASRNMARRDSLSFSESVSVLVGAAQHYINLSSSYSDPNISLASACLSLIKFHPDLERERKLIDVLHELHAFGVDMPPLKVRMCVDKKKILEKVLSLNPTAYKKISQLESLALNLETENVSREDLKLEIMSLSFETACQMGDIAWCISIYKLMEGKPESWLLCKKLCLCQDFNDFVMKQEMICAALLHCPDEELSFLLELRNRIECEALANKLQMSLVSTDEENSTAQEDNKTNILIKKELPSLEGLMNVPALLNMLQTSSTNMLNTKFWKSAFNFRSEDVSGNEISDVRNNDCSQLAFHEYYSDVHYLHAKCICCPLLEKQNEIVHNLLRYYLIKSQIEDSSETSDVENVISQLAIVTFPSDCLLSLSLVLLLRKMSCFEEVFNIIPNSSVAEKFALYVYSLKVLMESDIDVRKFLEEQSPGKIVDMAMTKVKESHPAYLEILIKYRNALEKRLKANKVHDLGYGIDPVRFMNDEAYKLDSILGVAMYEEFEKLESALSLGREYGVSSEDIVISHVKSMFSIADTPFLTDRLKEPVIINTLKENRQYCAQKLISEVYDTLSAYDYPKLLLFFALLNQVFVEELPLKISPKEHMKLIRKVKTLSNAINYKFLTADPPRIVEATIPAVLKGDLDNVLKLLNSMPHALTKEIEFDIVYKQLALKLFFNGAANVSHPKRFESCTPLLKLLPENIVRDVINEFLFSPYSSENLSPGDKQAIAELSRTLFVEVFGSDCKLENSLKIFSKLEEFKQICNAIDVHDLYVSELQNSIEFDEKDKIQNVIEKMVVDVTMSAESIVTILEFFRLGTLKDRITKLLTSVASENEKDIKALLYRIETCLEENDYEKSWGSEIMKLKEYNLLSTSTVNLIDNLCSILVQSDEEIYQIIDMLHETRLILRNWVSILADINIYDFISNYSRLSLVKKMIQKSKALSHFHSIILILKFWPPSSPDSEWSDNPYILLLEKMLCLDENEIPSNEVLQLFENIMSLANLSKATTRAFFEYMSGVPHNKILFIWFCVLSADILLIQSISGYIEEVRQVRKMPVVIENKLKIFKM